MISGTADIIPVIQYSILKRKSPECFGHASVAARLTWQGADPDKFPGENAKRFLLEMTERGLMENGSGNKIQAWRSAGPDRRILGLETAISAGMMVVRIKE